MYVPRPFALDDSQAVRAVVAAVGAADLVTVGADGSPVASLLPVLWDDDTDVVVGHFARANDQWRTIIDGARGLAIITAPQSYVSPSWYPSKAEHGRVVPTWNYTQVHLSGTVHVHDDAEWVRRVVTRLTERHESGRAEPWAVTDAPARFVDGQLRAIVGVELRVNRVEAKSKLSQNRSAADRSGVVAGLLADATPAGRAVAGSMGSVGDPRATSAATDQIPG